MFVILLCACIVYANAAPSVSKGPCHFDGFAYAAGETILLKGCLGTIECLGDESYGNMKELDGICPDKQAREVDGQTGCLFDGRVYSAGQTIIVGKCEAQLTCLGYNSYSEKTMLGGVCPEKQAREVDGQTGCLFDGRVYAAGQTIIIGKCEAQLTCLGYNSYSEKTMLGGVCPDKQTRDVDGQTGCLFDGRVYAAGQTIIIGKCEAQLTCLGYNSYSEKTMLGGVCPDQQTRDVDGQTGCLFDGRVYAAGQTIIIGNCEAKLTCLGYNNYSEKTMLGGQC
ncbi:uncharacterized protein LOC132760323 isoform X3 [Ruditapes philippinarum]|uniref:uncharacterized protein LOC132760323 isoform X3 n=1 Tax=Ruditapes philippinarum TaxID=129788 RepID=UPI00295C1FE9|nr:uncharacterized protein LOC132760323 isoform X3 [Ruditapes philippinarum]